jgi:predicted metalloprotease
VRGRRRRFQPPAGFDGTAQAPGQPAGIPPSEDPERDLKDFSSRRLQRENPDEANALSVRQDLQADCCAGVWANTVFQEGTLEEGDLDEASRASEAVGDDRLQGSRGGPIDPDSFTHGTSDQRRTWFNRGYERGEASACDPYSPDEV